MLALPTIALVMAAATVAASWLGFALGLPWLLPILDALPAAAILAPVLRRGRRGAAIGLMVWWALCLALTSVTLTLTRHARAEEVILNGAAYRDEMIQWLATGVGRESTPASFIPQHLLHGAIFCALALATAGALSLLMGAVLINYMSFYVGDLILRCSGSPSRPLAIAMAWNPWSMVRVVSFIILGVVLAEPLFVRLTGRGPDPAGRRPWLIAAAAGLLLDIVLKTLLAPRWPALLSACLG